MLPPFRRQSSRSPDLVLLDTETHRHHDYAKEEPPLVAFQGGKNTASALSDMIGEPLSAPDLND